MWKLLRLVTLINVSIIVQACCKAPVKSIENLKASISMLNEHSAKYSSFAKVAQDEHLVNISNLFVAMSASEKIQLANQRRILLHYIDEYPDCAQMGFEVGNTFENLKGSAAIEEHMFQVIYPKYNAVAVCEHMKEAETEFYLTAISAAKHATMLNHAARTLSEHNNDSLVVNSWSVCPQCGLVYPTSHLPEVCIECQDTNLKFTTFR